MTLSERQQKIIDEFSQISNWEDRYKRIIELGKQLPAMPEELKTDDLKIKGCQSQVWLHARLDESGRILFQADSDALIVKGLIALLLRVYSSATPEEVMIDPPTFIATIGLSGNLSPSRANGLFAMIKQIKYYATAFKALRG